MDVISQGLCDLFALFSPLMHHLVCHFMGFLQNDAWGGNRSSVIFVLLKWTHSCVVCARPNIEHVYLRGAYSFFKVTNLLG